MCAVAFDDDGATFRCGKLASLCFCCVVAIELASFYNGLVRLGELVAPECSLGWFCIGHAFDNTDQAAWACAPSRQRGDAFGGSNTYQWQ